MNKISKKLYPLVFLVGLVALILFQHKAIMPLVEQVVASDLFLVDTDDEGSRIASMTPMTNHAFIQCNKEILNEIGSDTSITLPSEPLQSWPLGNYKYLITAEIEVSPESGSSFFKKYACQIQYDEGSDLEGVMDSDNWSTNGISGISEL
ncbi:MAG: hypothetical protein methR_P0110 [Methyloprofundus sp.]|nr:MAG: hypothetical protein methR_P0110 [Methyloprofundus sp.]